jgi:transcriptional regulator with XRE-family HTH domain
MAAMSVQAVGGYVAGLIERHGLTIASVSSDAGVQPNYIWRLREGAIKEPAAETIGALVRAARGSYDRAIALLLTPNATEEDGRKAAREPDDMAVINRLPSAQRQLVLRLARELLREEFGEE